MCLTFSRSSYYALILETDLLRILLYAMLCRVSLISSGISSVDYCCRNPGCGFITAFADVLVVTLNPAVVANVLSAIDVSTDACFSSVSGPLLLFACCCCLTCCFCRSHPCFFFPWRCCTGWYCLCHNSFCCPYYCWHYDVVSALLLLMFWCC